MTFEIITYAALAALICACLARLLMGPTIWDRLLSFNLISSKVVMLIVAFALFTEKTYILDIALTFTLFSFIATVLIARFIRERGTL